MGSLNLALSLGLLGMSWGLIMTFTEPKRVYISQGRELSSWGSSLGLVFKVSISMTM